jgi:phosphatidylserine synthase
MKENPPGIIVYIRDLPNICSLAGLLSALVSLYCSSLSHYKWAVAAMLWAVVFDWLDGIVARGIKNRQDHQREFGAQLDSLIDMISFGACPALFLLSYGRFDPLFLPGAFIVLTACALRLSYFNIYGLIDQQTYKGLALDNNVIILAAFYLAEPFVGQSFFTVGLYLLLMILCLFNLLPVKTQKFSGRWFGPLTVYALTLTIAYYYFHP